MKKYGIKTVCKDSTPGFRSTDVTETWYDSESERNKQYEYLTKKVDPYADFVANKGLSDEYNEYTYTKIETK